MTERTGEPTTLHLRDYGRVDVRLDERARATIARVAESPAAYWSTRGRLPWT